MICAAGRQDDDWSADYRLFARDRWDPDDLFAPAVRGVLQLLPDAAPFVTGLDDTRTRKSGRKIRGVSYGRDPLSPAFAVASYAYLLLAALRAYGVNAQGPAIRLPKWQANKATQRVSTQKLLQALRSEMWADVLTRFETDSNDFVTADEPNTKSQESKVPLETAAIFARAG